MVDQPILPSSAHASEGSGERGPLNRAQIVATAIDLVDSQGVAALSMRRLGAEMGFEAMALYRYVDGREDLLDGMVDAVSRPVEDAANADVNAAGGWRAYLWHLAHQMRDLALRHPNIFPLVATRHTVAPWLTPPLRNLDVVEELLRTLIEDGFSRPQAAVIYRSFASFLLGQLLLTSAQEGALPAGAMEGEDPGSSSKEVEDFPVIASMESLLSASQRHGEEFDAGLEDLLDRIAEQAGEPKG